MRNLKPGDYVYKKLLRQDFLAKVRIIREIDENEYVAAYCSNAHSTRINEGNFHSMASKHSTNWWPLD